MIIIFVIYDFRGKHRMKMRTVQILHFLTAGGLKGRLRATAELALHSSTLARVRTTSLCRRVCLSVSLFFAGGWRSQSRTVIELRTSPMSTMSAFQDFNSLISILEKAEDPQFSAAWDYLYQTPQVWCKIGELGPARCASILNNGYHTWTTSFPLQQLALLMHTLTGVAILLGKNCHQQ